MPEVAPGLVAVFDAVGPELALILSACAFFTIAAFSRAPENPDDRKGVRDAWGWIALAAIMLATYFWIPQRHDSLVGDAASLLRLDSLAWFVKGAAFFGGALLVLVGWKRVPLSHAGEYYGSLLCALAGLSFIGMANDLVALFLALELVSIPTYVLLYLSKPDRAGHEATTKYFLLSIFSSAIVLFGLGYLYGMCGSTNLEVIRAALQGRQAAQSPELLMLALVLSIAGLGFRITAVPFHFYAPDVFEGTTPTMASFLSYVPKVAGFAALFRLIAGVVLLPDAAAAHSAGLPSTQIGFVVAILAVLTMFVGNVLALVQSDIRRLFAYSGVAHGGYMLVALSVGQPNPLAVSGAHAVWFYMIAYGAMTIGALAVISCLSDQGRPIRSLDDLRGLYRTQPYLAVTMAIFLFSLIGLPPSAGFLGKLQIFLALVGDRSSTFAILAGIVALNAAIGAWYYLRLLTSIFSPPRDADPPHAGPVNDAPGLVAVGLCAAISLGLFFYPRILLDMLAGI